MKAQGFSSILDRCFNKTLYPITDRNMELNYNQTTQLRYDKLSLWLLIYAFNYAFFHIIPVFLNYEIKNLLRVADLFDILTPFVTIFLIYKIYRILITDLSVNTKSITRSGGIIILILGTITFVEGHGMHLSANAINHYLSPAKDSSLFSLAYFFDEILGHILWDSGIVIISIGHILIGFRFKAEELLNPKPVQIIFASILYGFTYFCNAVEGQTVAFTFPLAIIIHWSSGGLCVGGKPYS